MKPVLAVVIFILAACSRAEEAVLLDASAFPYSMEFPTTISGELNPTCVNLFKLCQLGRLPAADEQLAAAGAATGSSAGTAGPAAGSVHTVQQQSEVQTMPVDVTYIPSTPARSASTTTGQAGQAAGHSTAHGMRQLHTSSNATANNKTSQSPAEAEASSTGSSSAPSISLATTSDSPVTACAGLDPQAVALLTDRYRGFQTYLALSDFFEIFYALGNLWYAITDLMKQALASYAAGTVQVNADSILLFDMNMASITAWWGSIVQNILLLKSDLIRPLPTDE